LIFWSIDRTFYLCDFDLSHDAYPLKTLAILTPLC